MSNFVDSPCELDKDTPVVCLRVNYILGWFYFLIINEWIKEGNKAT